MNALPTAVAHLPSMGPAVLLVDSNDFFRSGLAGILRSRGITVVAQCRTAVEAVAAAARLRPDVVLLEALTAQQAFETTREIAAAHPDAAVVILAPGVDEELVVASIAAGARGFVEKDVDADEFAAAVRSAGAGGSPISARAAVVALDRLRISAARDVAAQTDVRATLTRRETAILELLTEGLSNAEIAGRLVVSPVTVKHHVASVLDKLGADNRVQAAVYAVRSGLV